MRSADAVAAGTALQGVHGAIVLIAIGIVLLCPSTSAPAARGLRVVR